MLPLWRDRRPKQDTSQKLKGQLDCCIQLQTTKRDHLKQDGTWGPTTKFAILSAYIQYEKCIHTHNKSMHTHEHKHHIHKHIHKC